MNIDYEMALQTVAVATQDSFADVVKKVVWVVSFFDTGNPTIKSHGTVETYLDTDGVTSDTFTPFDNLTQTQILQWALDYHGGSSFLDSLLEGGHAANLEKLIADSTLTDKDVALIAES